MPSRSAVAASSSKTFGERVEPRLMTGPEPSGWLPISPSSIPGGVGGVRDVHRHRERRAQVVGRGARAVQPDLLLHRGDSGDRAGELSALVAAACDLERDEGAEAVVHRPRGEAAAGERDGFGGDNCRVADPDQLQGRVLVGGADVDVEALELDDLLALLLAQQVDRLAADDAGHHAVAGPDLDPLADQDLRIPAADRREVEKALLVDVGDREPDLVDVADDRQQWVGLADANDRRSDPVRVQIAERGGVAPGGRSLDLIARGPCRGE